MLRSRMQRLYYLPKEPILEERCAAQAGCAMKAGCLRFRAVPMRGIPLADYSMREPYAPCDKFMALPNTERMP